MMDPSRGKVFNMRLPHEKFIAWTACGPQAMGREPTILNGFTTYSFPPPPPSVEIYPQWVIEHSSRPFAFAFARPSVHHGRLLLSSFGRRGQNSRQEGHIANRRTCAFIVCSVFSPPFPTSFFTSGRLSFDALCDKVDKRGARLFTPPAQSLFPSDRLDAFRGLRDA